MKLSYIFFHMKKKFERHYYDCENTCRVAGTRDLQSHFFGPGPGPGLDSMSVKKCIMLKKVEKLSKNCNFSN